MSTPKKLRPGDHVAWNTSQGKTRGVVKRKITGAAKVGRHVATASPDAPQYEVQSDKTDARAIHRPDALKKLGK